MFKPQAVTAYRIAVPACSHHVAARFGEQRVIEKQPEFPEALKLGGRQMLDHETGSHPPPV